MPRDHPKRQHSPTRRRNQTRLTPFPIVAAVLATGFTVALVGDFFIVPTSPVDRVLRVLTGLLVPATFVAALLPMRTLAHRAGVKPWQMLMLSRYAKRHPNGEQIVRTALRRAITAMVVIGLLAVLIGMLTVVLDHLLTHAVVSNKVLMTVAILIVWSPVAISYVFHRRLFEPTYPIWPDMFNRCAKCGYDLSGSAHIGECPECSRPYTRAGTGANVHTYSTG